MTNKAIDPTSLDNLAATVDFSVKEANKAKVSGLLAALGDAHCPARLCRFGCSNVPPIGIVGRCLACPIRAALGRLVYGPNEGDSR
jgi:hypothetical protein